MGNETVSVFSYSDIGTREENQDSLSVQIYGKNLVAVLADGLGGEGDGREASELAVSNLILCGQDGTLPDADQVRADFFYTNEEICRHHKSTAHMKSTAVYLCIHESSAIWGHTGDSRLYHFYKPWGGKYELEHYTLDHSISQLAVYLGEITREEIPGHDGRSRLIHALGCEEAFCRIEDNVVLKAGMHGFLLCSDGFWENISETDMCIQLQNAEDAKEWVENMCQDMREKDRVCQDNNSAIGILMEVQQ
ncbi:MAG: protein phosphatase 2C domain-containing protein [Eubacteriales bacterium]|nr:protein phosphatase 2C domain-containing protein [Eubacteriales bacterium]